MEREEKKKQGGDGTHEKRIRQGDNLERKNEVTRVSDTEPPPPRRRDGNEKS